MSYIRRALELVDLLAQMVISLIIKPRGVSKDVLLSNHFIIKISLPVVVLKLVLGRATLIIQIRPAFIVHQQVVAMFQTAQTDFLLIEFPDHVSLYVLMGHMQQLVQNIVN